MLEVFNNLFMAIAEEMGLALQNTASSVNIKERLDFSCALFDTIGALIANAPHIPVHLGSMGDFVRTIIEARGDNADGRGIREGDVYVLNAPYHGGSHLPDVTVIMPAFDADGELVAFVASRGHHADIGGITPGSMPPFSRVVEEEGVLIDNVLLVDEGRFRETETNALLASGRYPARNPRQNIADLKAQVAACVKGTTELRALIAAYGRKTVHAYMRHVQDNAAECVRRVIDRLNDGAFACEMDNGAVVKVAITVDRDARTARVDFTGTTPQVPSNFNAPLSVCRAAVLYVFRTLIEDEIPLNDGCMRPITLIVPEGSMLNPRYPAAVVAGNVETSQAITDALYGALGVEAAAQGTMNNFTFGDGARAVLRDRLRRRGRGRRLQRRERRAHAHDQHAPRRSGDSRIALSGAARGILHPRGLGRARDVRRRQRRRAQDPLLEGDERGDPVEPEARRPVRIERRRQRVARPQRHHSHKRQSRDSRRNRCGRDAIRRRLRHRNTRRRRLRRP